MYKRQESEGYIRRKADASISSKDFYEIYRMSVSYTHLIPKWDGCCSGFSFYGSNATIVSFGSFSFSQFRRYAIALFAKRFVFMVSQSASRMISAVPFSKSNDISVSYTHLENEVADNMYQRSELDYLIYNDPIGYADLILNGNPETYLKTVTEYKPLDS